MDKLDEFYKKIQMYLMKKNRECGELKLINSCITLENNNVIDDVCKSMIEIFETYNIPIKKKALISNEMCVYAYKYLLLNTNFKCQERLAEDIVNGHLVDMCPPLSPYILMQILWSLEYEKILIQSLLYMPFDLCTEILEIIRKCIEELPFQSSSECIYQLIWTLYVKCFQIKEFGLQSINYKETLKNFLINFKEVLLLLTNPKVTHLAELSDLKKCERYGIIFQKLIRTIKNCLEYKTEAAISKDLGKLYTITFGEETFIKCEDTFMETMMTLKDELMSLLLIKVQEIDCNIYCSWAELDDAQNNTFSLQRSIGIECYYFVEFIKDDEYLTKNTQLVNCLRQLSASDSVESQSVLSIQELCHAIRDGKAELIKELLYRYKEWDVCRPKNSTFGTVLELVHENRALLDRTSYSYILDYLHFILTHSPEDDFKEYIYNFVIRMLSFESISDIYDIVIMYIMKYDGGNYLETPHTEKMFNDFISKSINFRSPENLKAVLLFFMKNPRKMLTILLKITIGDPQYRHIMISPNDLLFLSPFMQIRDENNQIFLATTLRTICLENIEWDLKKFINLIKIILDNSVIEVHDLINNVFIPYLEGNTLNVSNLKSILYNLRKLQTRYTKDTNVARLIIALANRMSLLRKSTNISKSMISEIFSEIIKILEYFVETKYNTLSISTKREIVSGIDSIVEPIDKLYFASLWHLSREGVNIIHMVEEYEKRCFIVTNKLKEDPNTTERVKNYLSDLNLLREDFLRHLILRSTDTEYIRLASEITIVYWFAFGWSDEIEACNHFLCLTMQACCLSLEYPSIGGTDLFASLLKSFRGFYGLFLQLEGMKDEEKLYQALIRNINSLDESIKQTSYAPLFTALLAHLSDIQQNSEHLLEDVLNTFYEFTRQCLELSGECNEVVSVIPHSPKISNLYITHEIISACIKVPATEANECISKMNDLF